MLGSFDFPAEQLNLHQPTTILDKILKDFDKIYFEANELK
jgi:hypothetical protein